MTNTRFIKQPIPIKGLHMKSIVAQIIKNALQLLTGLFFYGAKWAKLVTMLHQIRESLSKALEIDIKILALSHKCNLKFHRLVAY